ncbi:MAG: hypothetical protein M3O31_00115 [Acidobacteriota bacterium]|nr:hypothetical protein [Acidobacteriota bacterium]
MNRLLFLVPLGALFVSNAATAQSPFDGTWKISLNNVAWSPKPDMFLLDKGMYTCKTCTPAYTIKADGSDQAVTGHPYVDTIAIKVVNDHEVQETDKKGGKVVGTSTTTVSADGKKAMWSFIDSSNTNGGPPVTGKGESTLVAKGPAGSHAVSGSWHIAKMADMSDNGLIWSYKVTGNTITMNSKSGQSYTAMLDGMDAPMKGDPGTTSVSVKMLGKNVMEETDKRDGKAISVMTLTVAPDGKTAKAKVLDKLANRTTAFNIVKQ